MHVAAESADAATLSLLARGGLQLRDINTKNLEGLTPIQVGLRRQDVDAEWREAFVEFLKAVDRDFPRASVAESRGFGFRGNGERPTIRVEANGSGVIHDLDDEFEDAVEFQS